MNRPLTLASSVAGAVVVALDGTVLTVARPTMQRDLDASLAQVQWTGTGYLVAVAGLLVFAGRLGDRYGHRRTFAVGMLGFGAASAGLCWAPGVGWVIGLRVVQGVFGALLQPATLGMLRTSFPPDRLRTPIAVRTAAIGLAAAAGPVVGGALVTAFGWRAVFLLNIVPALLFGVLALASREKTRPTVDTPLDVPGSLLLAAALACLAHTLVTLPGVSWSAAGALLAGAAFVRHERRTPVPLLPPAVVGSPAVGASLGLLVAVSAALNGALFACVYLLQDDLGLTPLHTALLSLPLAVLLIAAAPTAAILLRRAGARATVTGATAVLAAGLLVLAEASGQAAFGVGFALLGAGFGTVMVAATHVVVHQAPAASAGVAGALQQTAMNVGPVLGVASATVLMELGTARSPLLVMALAAAAALPVCRALPGRPRPASSTSAAPSAGLPAGGSDAPHTNHGVENDPSRHSLRDHEV
ncbi:MFS transporter [Streptomyces sp. NBC_01275]|uniref:MFS transporter n=1 Tax=Streptomyces sp. NBC_01275 TaxID=2903807 RepID=UPI00225B9952|nr:MFS transporter [Streptomyces sp. NBC_01275]MCX4766303.1 MFS transporter [Streptomyces sp. NBC_01275]